MKIIIIGNGFDLSLGLKTSYKNFIQSDYFISLLNEDNTLAMYLNEKQEINNWVDIEKELTEYSKQIKDGKLKVKNDFKELKNALMDYLKEAQEKEINQNTKAFEMMKNEISNTDMIYNFNYTNSVFRVAEILGISGIESKHSFVHGSIENSDIIFGVEDNARINKEHIFFKKSSNINFAKSNIINVFNDINKSNTLIIFGHSLGITDSSYFEDYFINLTLVDNCSVLNFHYFNDEGYEELMKILNEYTQNNLTKLRSRNTLDFFDSSI